MRLLYTLFTLALGGYGLYWVADKNPDLKQKAEEFLDFRTTTALETRYDATQVMELHQKQLLKEKGSRFLTPELKFFPHLLLEVKYSDSKGRTKESLMLWDLTEGEMILDFKTWEKTHGFADCILAHAQPHEFKILQALTEKGGSSDIASLHDKLQIEIPLLETMLQGCIKKNLILQTSFNKYRLHLESPRLTAVPETKFEGQLTTRPHKRATRAQKYFSISQIERTTRLSFGEGFSIRKSTEVYLPIHRIIVQKPDGSIQTFHFNALTGKELPPARFYN